MSGFGTVGIAQVHAPDRWAYSRDLLSANNPNETRIDLDTRLGVQFNYSPVREFELVAQLVAMRRASLAPKSDMLEWAFVAWRPDTHWTLRAGRMNLDAFLLSEYRNVGFAYPFVRPPVEFYWQLPKSFDGLDITRSWNNDGTVWKTKFFAGRSFTFADSASRLKLQPTYGAMISRDSDGLLIRASAVGMRFKNNPSSAQPLLNILGSLSASAPPQIADQAENYYSRLATLGSDLAYLSIGARYESGPWLAGAEYMRLSGHPTAAYSSGYVNFGRRFGALTTYAIASYGRSRASPVQAPNWDATGPQGQLLANITANAINQFRVSQHTLSAGVRYDISSNQALKIQWDQIRVDANGSAVWSGNKGLGAADSRVVSLVLDFVF